MDKNKPMDWAIPVELIHERLDKCKRMGLLMTLVSGVIKCGV
jgi:hypothetical protein